MRRPNLVSPLFKITIPTYMAVQLTSTLVNFWFSFLINSNNAKASGKGYAIFNRVSRYLLIFPWIFFFFITWEVDAVIKGKYQKSLWWWNCFCILTVSLSITWLWYCTTVLQDVTIMGNLAKCTWDLCTVSYNCIWIHNYLKTKSLIKKVT